MQKLFSWNSFFVLQSALTFSLIRWTKQIISVETNNLKVFEIDFTSSNKRQIKWKIIGKPFASERQRRLHSKPDNYDVSNEIENTF